jgi:hypothetical protein
MKLKIEIVVLVGYYTNFYMLSHSAASLLV